VVGLGTGIRRRQPPDPAVLEGSSVIPYGSVSSSLAVCWRLGLVVIIAQFAVSQSSPANQRIPTGLPPCSVLRSELERRNRSDGADQPYMQKMRQQGVKHALLLIHADLRQGKTNNIHVDRRLYSRSFDGPDAQILDQTALKTIESSGLGTDLEAMPPSPKLVLGTTVSENGAGEASPQRVQESTSDKSANLGIVEIFRNHCPDRDQHSC
jgi:hypothetical protein